ncbi:MAG: ComEC/Rec2 family competence protein, partial [Arcobacter sp.]
MKNKQIVTILFLFSLFLLNISIEYSKYLDLVDEEIYETKVEVLNIYNKEEFNILRLKADNYDFFTNIDKKEDVKKSDLLNIIFISKNISFLDYLKGFYTKTISFDILEKSPLFRDKIVQKIDSIHQNEMIKELF